MPEIHPHLAAWIERTPRSGRPVLLHARATCAIGRRYVVVVERKADESDLRRANRSIRRVEKHSLARGDRNRARGARIVKRVLPRDSVAHVFGAPNDLERVRDGRDRKSTRLNSSHL